MVPQCDSLEGNAKSFGAKINKSEKICPFYQKKKQKNPKKNSREWCCTGKLKLMLGRMEGIVERDFV